MSKENLKTWSDAVIIPIDKLVLTDWNCNEMSNSEFAILCEEIKDGGFDEPCQVVPLKGENQGKYLVLGGEHRFKACRANSLKEVPCVIKEHLSDSDEKALMLWSVRRNNIRGRIDEQKYAKLEQRLKERWGIAAEAARKEMLMKTNTMEALKRSPAMDDNESLELSNDDDEISSSASDSSMSKDGSGGYSASGNGHATDGESTTKKKFADRRALLQALKAAEQEVLLESGDTVEHGYLFFGHAGGLHLVLNEDKTLHDLVSRMVSACKANSDSVSELLISALTKEIPQWE